MSSHIKLEKRHLEVDKLAASAIELRSIWLSIGALKVLENYAEESTVTELHGVLRRHASGDHGDLDQETSYQTPGIVRSIYNDELKVETDLHSKVTRLTRA